MIATLLLLAQITGTAPQDTGGGVSSLSLRTGPDSAWVFIDSTCAGRTPLTVDSLRPGRHLLRLLEGEISSWLSTSITDTIFLAPGESRTLRYTFGRRVMVVTDPSGALVYLGDSVAGSTPLVIHSRTSPLPDSVRVERKGYEQTMIALPAAGSGVATAVLRKIWQSEPSENPLMSESGGSERTGVRLYVAGIGTVAAGVAAAYFKIKADEKNALFEQTGDPSLQRETHRLDTSAAIALVATQIGFALFSYFLLSD